MTTTPNGWPTSPRAADFGGLDNREVPGAAGVHLAPGVRSGDPATVLFAFAALFHAHVEPLRAGQCWGFAYRPNTNNPKVLTEHAGAAIDLNAPEHPNGKRGTFTHDQVGVLRALLAGFDGLITWGGDFSGTDDEMHFELVHDLPKLAAMAAKLNGATPAPAPAPGPAPEPVLLTGHDATGHGAGFRAHLGDEGPRVEEMQHDLNRYAPAYSHLEEDGVYGQQTAAVLDEFAHREAHEADTPAGDRKALEDSDGNDVGPRTASAFLRDGLHL